MGQTISLLGDCVDLEVRKGTTVTLTLEIEDEAGDLIDISDYTFPAAIVDKTGVLIYEFDPAAVVSATQQMLTISATVTGSTVLPVGTYNWAVNAVKDGVVQEFRQGICRIYKQIVP